MYKKDNRNLYKEKLPKDGYWDEELSLGEGIKNSPKIRVPKLCRKTAWKRFYKLYPHLKGMKVIPGSYSSVINGGNPSTIKLKKIKKKK